MSAAGAQTPDMGVCWRLVYRLPWLLVHLFIGLPLTLLSFAPPLRVIKIGPLGLNEIMQGWWASRLCRIFGLRSRLKGDFVRGPALVAANHIAWLDIQLLHGFAAMGFVAKAEIERWPVAGWVAGFGETVFHRRGSHDSSSNVLTEMKQRLEAGRKVAIFPEGGILPGEGIKRFHARMFAAAIEAGVPVQPVMLRYLRGGRLYPEITFLPGENFMANLLRLLCQPACTAEVRVLEPIDPRGMKRDELARMVQQAVTAAYDSGLPA